MNPKRKINATHIWLPLYFLAFTFVFINTSWVNEDIYITFRAVDNFLKGYGPVWNVGERVQVYTHPLWYFLLIIGIGIFKHHYWFTLALSYACLLGTLFLFLKVARHGNAALVMLASVALLLSRAFADYSSSGLENPLLHLLLCAYVLVAITQQDAAKRFLHTGLLYSLLFLTRPDSIFIVTPASIWMLWQAYKASGWRRTIKLAIIAAAPALAWETFSLIYYGSLVPNTAIAKTNLGYPRSEMLARGWSSLEAQSRLDPFALGIMVLAAPATAFLAKNRLPSLLMAGVALQILYILFLSGGDYFVGRFFSTSVLMSALALACSHVPAEKKNLARLLLSGGMGMLLIALFIAPAQTMANIIYWPDYSHNTAASVRTGRYGEDDIRGNTYYREGLVPIIKKRPTQLHAGDWHKSGRALRDRNTANVELARRVIGAVGWNAGPKPYLVDPLALSDPFLSRLPARRSEVKDERFIRTGHYTRDIPRGYIQSLITGANAISHPAMASLYSDVALATRAPLFSKNRMAAIWRLNSNFHKITLDTCLAHRDDSFDFIDFFRRERMPYTLGAPPAFSPFIAEDSPEDGVARLKRALAYGDPPPRFLRLRPASTQRPTTCGTCLLPRQGMARMPVSRRCLTLTLMSMPLTRTACARLKLQYILITRMASRRFLTKAQMLTQQWVGKRPLSPSHCPEIASISPKSFLIAALTPTACS